MIVVNYAKPCRQTIKCGMVHIAIWQGVEGHDVNRNIKLLEKTPFECFDAKLIFFKGAF
jgi:hypothetical protein